MQIEFLTPQQLQYPGMVGQGCAQTALAVSASGAVQPAPRDGLFNSVFTPDDLPYPLPVMQQSVNTAIGNVCALPSVPLASPSSTSQPTNGATTGSATTGNASPQEQPATPSQIIINVGVPAAAATMSTQTGAATTTPASAPAPVSAPASTPTPTAPPTAPASSALGTNTIVQGAPPPSDTVVKMYSYNPRLRARVPKAQEELIEEMLGEKITMRMMLAHAVPVAFVVPDGANAVEFFLDPIELNPNAGEHGDLDLVVTVGTFTLSENARPGSGPLKPGDQIAATLSWRYASWVELAPEHLRVPINARFFAIQYQ